jgi:hypothetical protein
MQRTSDGVIDDEPFGKRPAVVSTCCAEGKEFRAPARQNHFLIANPSLNHPSVWNEIDSHTGCEIRCDTARHTSVLRNDPLQIMRLLDAA